MDSAAILAFKSDVLLPALASAYPGDIRLEGVELTGLSVYVSQEGPVQLAEGRTIIAQTLTVNIPKSALLKRPEQGSTITHLQRGYKLDQIGGDGASDTAWRIVAVRMPGADV
jgi:hypothetical protein